MHTNRLVQALIVAVGVGGGTFAARGAAFAVRSARGAPVVSPPSDPRPFDADPDMVVTTHPSRHVHQFVDRLMLESAQQGAWVIQDDGSWCQMDTKATRGSHAIIKARNSGAPNGYVVGIVFNFDPNHPCKPRGTSLMPADTIAWIVRFDTPTVLNGKASGAKLGKSWVVVLSSDPAQNDRLLTPSQPWQLGQCNNSAGQGQPDNVLVLTRGTICDLPMNYKHNAVAVREAFTSQVGARMKAGRGSNNKRRARAADVNDDLGLWFACGADCCWTDIIT